MTSWLGVRVLLQTDFEPGFAKAFEKVLDEFRIKPLGEFSARDTSEVGAAGEQFVQGFLCGGALAQLTMGSRAGERCPEVARHLDAQRRVDGGAIISGPISVEDRGQPVKDRKVGVQPHGGIGDGAAPLPLA